MNSHENQLQNTQESQLKNIVDLGVERALQTIHDRHEAGEQTLDFHNQKHTRQVIERTTKIAEAFGLDEKTIATAQLIAAFHDTVQDGYSVANKYKEYIYNEDGQLLLSEDSGFSSISGEEGFRDENPNYGMFKRFTGANEVASFEELRSVMTSTEGQLVFDDEDIALAEEAFLGTVPGFDPERGAITQPNISERSSEVTLAVAMADLGAAGMEGAESLLYDGDANFREEHMKWSYELRQAVEESRPFDDIDDETKQAISQKMIGWTKFQKKIASDQRGFFQERMQWLENRGTSEDELQALSDLFPTFKDDASFQAEIAKIDAKIAEREAMNFEDLVKDMYPDIAADFKKNVFAAAELAQTEQDEQAAQDFLKQITGNN
jgi:hypothetical protein